jgi:hypothetical protein
MNNDIQLITEAYGDVSFSPLIFLEKEVTDETDYTFKIPPQYKDIFSRWMDKFNRRVDIQTLKQNGYSGEELDMSHDQVVNLMAYDLDFHSLWQDVALEELLREYAKYNGKYIDPQITREVYNQFDEDFGSMIVALFDAYNTFEVGSGEENTKTSYPVDYSKDNLGISPEEDKEDKEDPADYWKDNM